MLLSKFPVCFLGNNENKKHLKRDLQKSFARKVFFKSFFNLKT